MSRASILRALEIPALIAVPVVLAVCAIAGWQQTALLSLAVVIVAVGVFFASFERSRPALRNIMPTVVLAAIAAAGRIICAPLPNIQPVTAICLIAGAMFGKRCGFMVGAMAALVSNFFLGQGAWTPWQMYAWGLVGYLAGVLSSHGLLKRQPAVYACGIVAPAVYGFILNSFYIVSYISPLTLTAVIAGYTVGIALDLAHIVSTVVFLALLWTPWHRKLERIRLKYALTA